ncbi:MAG: tRNA preQ1(34) S-adenosylmethionine ribosyltransferase-isomerase QueA [Deltaproteobacteria bacterium]|nr:tRNA preQ1(34) S-adenosylmethionine ribosyltransferase-isomerase QueA [Deltaproteobacteria bacterium]
MRLSELDYELPEEMIAQYPLEQRAQARLMVVERCSGAISHSRFYKLPRGLREGDLLVLNDTSVIPARLMARKESGGAVELLLVRPVENIPGQWQALVRTHRTLRAGTRLMLRDGCMLRIVAQCRPGRVLLESTDSRSIEDILAKVGTPALPHYIRRAPTATDITEYQTVYAAKPGAIAAPTAGIHFTPELLNQLREAGIPATFITLHIGPGTFTPLRAPQVEHHSMEAEWYTIPDAGMRAIELARRTGGRVIAVGTSTARALESYAITGECEGFTGLFIFPGFRFKLVDAMVTNFHMPRSTVLALVMALAGRELILRAYAEAIRHRYRFLSYGDAMLII